MSILQTIHDFTYYIISTRGGELTGWAVCATTVQLSSKVTFAHVSDVSRTRSGCTPVWQKRGVALTYVLLQLYREVLHLHGRVSHASQTHLARVSDAFGPYLVPELYCINAKAT